MWVPPLSRVTAGPDVHDLVVICTRNRPKDLVLAVDACLGDDNDVRILVVDASGPEEKALNHFNMSLRNILLIDHEPGLTQQRNAALKYARREAVSVVHFIDDDTIVQAGYLGAIRKAFLSDIKIAGVGGVVLNQPLPKFPKLKSFFLLYGREPGKILKSGRNVIGHYPTHPATDPDWLPGCCMSYRLDCLDGLEFDSTRDGYAWGEDFDFSFRLSREHPLSICPDARILHMESPVNRLRVGELSRTRTVALHGWVVQHQIDGMSRCAFAWSAVGEVLLRSLSFIKSMSRDDRDTALGVCRGIWDILLTVKKR
jgi:GT2 family glycosyltransferase